MSNRKLDHELMARAIRYLEETREAQPSLDQIAAHLGVSPSHLQRVFTAWVGISPKNYQQYLTLDFAKRLLADQQSTLAASLESGLSSPGRLHDLLVKWEAMTPGEYQRKGQGLTISYGWFDSPFGDALGLSTDRGLCGLAFATEFDRATVLRGMQKRWPKADYVESQKDVMPFLTTAFDGKGEVRLLLSGTPFQLQVWKALMEIPFGAVTSYGNLAKSISLTKQHSRAVGTAIGSNPISWLIPCHRVLRTGGGMGGYAWGLDTKREMLVWEGARAGAATKG